MGKYCIDLIVCGIESLTPEHFLLRLTGTNPLPLMVPGQFVEVRIDHSPTTFLRRPFSINFVDRSHNELWLLVHVVGDGTSSLSCLKKGDTINCILPLGKGFSTPNRGESLLLVGGGVGVAPLLFLGAEANSIGAVPTFLIGARTKTDLLELRLFEDIGHVYVTTEDGSYGERGFVTSHSILEQMQFDKIKVCGPRPMMQAMAGYAGRYGVDCEVCLENMMACGLGACLCCVEKTIGGNVCVCKEGPVFNVKNLLWRV